MHPPQFLCRLFIVILILSNPVVHADNSDDELIQVPIRAFYINNDELGEVSVTRDQQSLAAMLADVNRIWKQANIQFYFIMQGFYVPKDLERYNKLADRDRERDAVMSLCPRTNKGVEGIDFCIINQFKSNKGPMLASYKTKNLSSGRYEAPPLGRSNASAPRIILPIRVGSRINPNPVVVARMLGRTLRLDWHRNKEEADYLMGKMPRDLFSGRYFDRILLKEAEVERARNNAAKIALDPPEKPGS